MGREGIGKGGEERGEEGGVGGRMEGRGDIGGRMEEREEAEMVG